MANGLELRSMALLLRSMALLQDLDTLLHGHELRRPQLCCGAYAVQRAEGGEPLEQMGALAFGEHGRPRVDSRDAGRSRQVTPTEVRNGDLQLMVTV